MRPTLRGFFYIRSRTTLPSLLRTSQRVPISHELYRTDNCFVWSLDQKKVIYSFLNRNTNNWLVQWTLDESFFVRFSNSPGELIITNSCAPYTPCFSFKDRNMVSFCLSPSETAQKIAIYFEGDNGSPSNIRIFSFPGGLSTLPRATKSFYKADRVDLLWNHTGSHLIAFIHSDEDKNGKSYYGHESIVFISADGSLDCQLRLDSEGPIHAVEWSPVSNEFIVVYGSKSCTRVNVDMPARAKIFDSNCRPVFDFGSSPRNFVKFNPFGNLICMSGFGNLSGSVEIWDRVKLKKISCFKAPGTTTLEWSPDGRFLLLATLSPRLRVDNGIKIYDFTGGLVSHVEFSELLQVVGHVEAISEGNFCQFSSKLQCLEQGHERKHRCICAALVAQSCSRATEAFRFSSISSKAGQNITPGKAD
ncbi:hypothetical protein DI09_2p480 [Mitosporidium daphniae]|uniref:Eukaryotic translation initiation factor 2A n=1 Tax=Mitosporidium daphniae TaxID=1485682 RepID=A0A098VVA9_9MICR|nr:uncharacterized protein DI09_2p480 [Mitosporidium daphniae]KGG51671.1 hypothetical protein DI09_2p480 [Mitosporidium daphniae]|eukprot:XP_013238098.1 uncharacterized protein DI09_2p480 [Mitosporidium daphniae]